MHLFHSSEVLPHLPLHLLFQVLPAGQQEEQRYYEEIIGLKGTFLFCRHPSGSPSQDHQWTGLYAR